MSAPLMTAVPRIYSADLAAMPQAHLHRAAMRAATWNRLRCATQLVAAMAMLAVAVILMNAAFQTALALPDLATPPAGPGW